MARVSTSDLRKMRAQLQASIDFIDGLLEEGAAQRGRIEVRSTVAICIDAACAVIGHPQARAAIMAGRSTLGRQWRRAVIQAAALFGDTLDTIAAELGVSFKLVYSATRADSDDLAHAIMAEAGRVLEQAA